MMKRWISFDFEKIDNKKKKVSNGSVLPKEITKKPNVTFKKSFDFNKRITPKDSNELAVNKKKIDLLKQWLLDCVIDSKRNNILPMLVITGPTGCGKTITLNVLCQELNIEVLEWINPISTNYEFDSGPGQSTKFLDFIFEAKYPSLFTDNKKKVVLVEDFPNIFIRSSNEFHSILEKVIDNTDIPIVFICTETNNIKTDLYQNLFSDDVRLKYNISTISFNAASVTLLKNALKRVQSIIEERKDIYTVPSVAVLEAISNSSMGDIRCAVNNYHMVCFDGANVIKTTEINNKKRKRRSNNLSTTEVLRDHTLGIFHLLGRVLNPKRKKHLESWRVDCNIEEIVDELSTYPTTGVSLLKHNYLKYFNDFDEACTAADILSQTQLFMETFTESSDLQNLALWYCTLGLMITNQHKASKWNQIKATKRSELTENSESMEIDPTDGFYYDVIQKTNKFHKFSSSI